MKVVTMNDIKRILTPDVMRTLESIAKHLSESFGVKWVARELKNK